MPVQSTRAPHQPCYFAALPWYYSTVPAAAELLAERGAFLVPTLVTYQQLAERGEGAGMRPELVAKVGDLVQRGLQAVAIAKEKGEEALWT